MDPTDFNKLFQELTENKNNKKNHQTYVPAIIKDVFNEPILKKILDAIPRIFDENDEDSSVNKKTVKRDDKVLVIEKLLETSDSLDLNIGYENNIIYIYSETYWKVLNTDLFKHFLIQVAINCGTPELIAKNVNNNEFLFSQFIFAATIYKKENNYSGIKINLKNGTFHIKDGELNEVSELKKHNKEDFFKYQLPFSLEPEAKAPIFLKYLNRVLPDVQSQKILFEYIGYIFTKNMKLEKVLILYGPGSNGKSVFFEIITALFCKDNVSTFSMENLCNENGYYRIHIASKLVNYASEFGGKINHQIFKKLVSGEPVEARSPREKPVIIYDYCKFIFNANNLPNIEHTDAFFRRPLILSFNQKISEEEKDINLAKSIINNELSGVFNMVLDGLDRLIAHQGFTKSSVVDQELINYRKESNSVSLFLDDENWKKSTVIKIKLHDLYNNYKSYCLESGHRTFTRNNFSKRLKELDYEIQLKGTNNYTYVWAEKVNGTIEINPFTDLDTVISILN